MVSDKFPILILIFFNFFHKITSNCPKISCSQATPSFNNTCALDSGSGRITLNLCGNYQICFTDSFDKYKMSNFSQILGRNFSNCRNFPLTLSNNLISYENDFCTNNTNCVDNLHCINNICKSPSNNFDCRHTSECSTNQYCNNKSKCVARKNDYEVNCNNDYECPNTSGCYDKICTPLRSLPFNTKVKGTIDKQIKEDYCISNTIHNDTCDDLILTGSPYCNSDNTCTYKSMIQNKTVNLTGKCNCDPTTGYAMCALGTNTPQYLEYINAMLARYWYPCSFYNKGMCYLVPQLAQYYYLNASFAAFGFVPLRNELVNCFIPPQIPKDVGNCQELNDNPCPKLAKSIFNSLNWYFIITILIIFIND